MLKNQMEIIVENHLPAMLSEDSHLKNCEKCRYDCMSIALNNLKPMYVMTDKGAVYNKLKELDLQFQTDVVRELYTAITYVESHPRHE